MCGLSLVCRVRHAYTMRSVLDPCWGGELQTLAEDMVASWNGMCVAHSTEYVAWSEGDARVEISEGG